MRTLKCTASALVLRDLPDGNDTGNRIIKDQVVAAYGESYDSKWAYVKAPAGSGWASNDFLLPALQVLHAPWPRVPNGLVQIRETFGDPGQLACHSGVVILPAMIGSVAKFFCHALMAPVFTSVFTQVHDKGLWDLLHSFDGCYNDRSARDLVKKSTHAWGITVDLNASENPLGAKPKQDPRLTAVFIDHGFIWGGSWSRPDGMHYQYASGY